MLYIQTKNDINTEQECQYINNMPDEMFHLTYFILLRN